MKIHAITLALTFTLGLITAPATWAQSQKSSSGQKYSSAKDTRVTPCCSITNIDPQKSVVTALDTKTGRSVEVKVKTKMLNSLKVGQPTHLRLRDGRPLGSLSWACTEDMKTCGCTEGADCDSICVDEPKDCNQGVCSCTGPGTVPPPNE